MSICLLVRFKNERHIMYEFINHYLEEGVDCFIMIDDNSDDNYLDNQPKSVIHNNLYTHSKSIDPTSPSKGYKYIVKTKVIKRLNIHNCDVTQYSKNLCIKNCHNNLIQNNHYRTQSEEYLRGVKEIRGGGVHKLKYKNFNNHKKNIYKKKCNLLMN